MDRLQTFRVDASRPDVEAACRRALRSVDWQELPTETFTIERPAGGGAGDLDVLIELIPPLRRLFARLQTRTLHAPPLSPRSQAAIYAVWGQVVMVTISLREHAGFGTEVTIAGQGGFPGKAATAVGELRHAIEIQSGSLTPSPRP